jgi:hypothetical protein
MSVAFQKKERLIRGEGWVLEKHFKINIRVSPKSLNEQKKRVKERSILLISPKTL